MDQIKKFSPAAFVIVIFCFFLPFVNITCGGQTVMSLTGIQLITGAEYKPEGMFDQQNIPGDISMKKDDKLNVDQKIDFQPMALLALIMAASALGFSFVKKKIFALICMIDAILGAAFLLLLKVNLDGDASTEAQIVIQIEYQIGYWLALVMFIVGAVLQWFSYKESESPVTISGLPTS